MWHKYESNLRKHPFCISSTPTSVCILFVLLVIDSYSSTGTEAFVFPTEITKSGVPIPRVSSFVTNQHTRFNLRSSSSSSSATIDKDDLANEIRSKRVKEIKEELTSLGIRTDDVFEKEELVVRLMDARWKGITAAPSTPKATSTTTTRTQQQNPTVTTVPLLPISLKGARRVDATNSRLGDVTIDPRYGNLRTITITLPSSPSPDQTLNVMVDTACSGLVLRPSAVQRHGLPGGGAGMGGISMTTAGGTTAGQTGLSRIERFVLDDGAVFEEGGGTPVAVQEIGALPPSVDGIIGLSFLKRFRTVTFDFSRDELVLSNDRADEGRKKREEIQMEGEPENYLETLTDATLRTCRLGIYAVSVTLDGRGPVSMLLDTGASASYLNWAGITEDMNLSNDHPLVRRNVESLGAMGADDTALELTHRFVCQRRLKLEGGGDPFLTGLDLTESTGGVVGGERGGVNVDIGDLPVLEGLKGEGVNGILGADLLTMCDVLRIDFGVSPPKMALERKVGDTSVPYLDSRRKS